MRAACKVGPQANGNRVLWTGEPRNASPDEMEESKEDMSRLFLTTTAQHSRLRYVLGKQNILIRVEQQKGTVGIPSPVAALAIIRAVERRFGKVAEYRFNRDSETSSRFQVLGYLAFKDPASYDLLPPSGPAMLRATVPASSIASAPGGVGLGDLLPYLNHDPQEDDDGGHVIEFKLEQRQTSL